MLASLAIVPLCGLNAPARAGQEAEAVSPPAVSASSPDPAPAASVEAAPAPPAEESAAPTTPPPAAEAAAAAPPPAPAEAATPQLQFAPFDDKMFLEAKRSGAPIGLYFEADWCHPCREMHARTLRDPAVLEAAAGYRLFRVDMTRPGGYLELVEKSFRIIGAPTVIVFGPDGKERSRRFGFIPPADFARMLDEGRKPSPAS